MKNKSNINGESTLNALAQLIGESSRLSRAIIEKKSVMISVLNVIFSEPSVREPSATAGCKLGFKSSGPFDRTRGQTGRRFATVRFGEEVKAVGETQKRSHRRAINRETDAKRLDFNN